jgi:hypothetical protein
VVFATVGVGLVVTGVLLGTEPGRRPNARLFVAIGFLRLSNELGGRITDRLSRIVVVAGSVALLVPHHAGNLVRNPDEAGSTWRRRPWRATSP